MTHAQLIAGALATAEESEGRWLTQEQRAGLLALIEKEVAVDPLWLPDDMGQGLLAAVRLTLPAKRMPLRAFVGILPALPDGELAEDALARIHGDDEPDA